MINLGKAFKHLREKFELSQRAAAMELDISVVYVNRLENDKVAPTSTMIDRIFDQWGVDLYVLAACLFADESRFPGEARQPMRDLKAMWVEEIERIARSRTDKGRCENARNSKSRMVGKVD